MVSTYYYNTHSMKNTQDELQKLAEDIFKYGKVTEVHHHGYDTNRYSDDGSMTHVLDGGLCYVVKGSVAKYCIHMRGLRVTEIIEEIDY